MLHLLPLLLLGTCTTVVAAEREYSTIYGAEPKSKAFSFPAEGWATLTHYGYPLNFLGSCGCAAASSHYPVAALNSLALGTDVAFGASCGSCARITLVSTLHDLPPPRGTGYDFGPNNSSAPSIVVKVTDQCPWSVTGSPCNATSTRPNAFGSYIHFDMAWPAPSGSSSESIPDDWFPNHHHDYGAWNATYEFVPCDQWAGWGKEGTLGSEPSLGAAGCCPASPPLPGNETFGLLSFYKADQPSTCPAYKIARGNPPAITPDTIFTSSLPGSGQAPSSTTALSSSSGHFVPTTSKFSAHSVSLTSSTMMAHPSSPSVPRSSSTRRAHSTSSTRPTHHSSLASSLSQPADHHASHSPTSLSTQYDVPPSPESQSKCRTRRSSASWPKSSASSTHPTKRSHPPHPRRHMGLPPLLVGNVDL